MIRFKKSHPFQDGFFIFIGFVTLQPQYSTFHFPGYSVLATCVNNHRPLGISLKGTLLTGFV
jgi:hypothetical protein